MRSSIEIRVQTLRGLSLMVMTAILCTPICAEDYERDPISYNTAATDNPVSRLQLQLDQDSLKLEKDNRQGYLASVLRALEVPVSSQTLVFSKTSLQRNRITPKTPRAIYFNDDVYVGYCHRGDVLEVSAVDPSLGAVFYTMGQGETGTPKFIRQTDNCLICHSSSNSHGVPGHLVRSVYVDHSGLPVLSMGTHRINQTSPIEQRWGGWYVTGTHGNQKHLGNLIVANSQQREPVENSEGQNQTNLDGRINTANYLARHSDLIALMVLEHQSEAHNLLTRASFQTREALYGETRLNKDLGEPEDHRWESTNRRIESACEALVKYLLFCDEAPLTAKFEGTSSFATDFANRGPKDSQGRSLRDFDLERRLFRYPCSYLVYSRSFDALPDEARNFVLKRMWQVLTGEDRTKSFAHLSVLDRQSILEILRETKPNLPDYWRNAANMPSVDSQN